MSTPVIRSAFVPHDLAAPISGASQGPLAGLTAAVKDMYDIEGYRTGGGNPDWLAAQQPARSTCPAVKKILGAGATVIGKTICDEFFFSVAGINFHYGTPVNPRAAGRMPGGSSSGSAAATAAGTCDFALGSDTGGSVRIPAAFCGLYGIRPTHGRVDLSGAMPMAPSFDVAGWFSCGPGIFRHLGGVLLEGASERTPIKNLFVLDDAFAEVDADIANLLRAVLASMRDELPKPDRARIAPDGFDIWRECFRVIQGREIWDIYGDFVTQKKPKLGPGIHERMAYASTVSENDARAAREIKVGASAQIRNLVKPGTILALPTAPCIAPRVDISGDALESFRVRVMRLTCISGMSGLPQVTLPAGTLAGCPVGLSFIGWEGADEILLDLAVRLSRFCGGDLRTP